MPYILIPKCHHQAWINKKDSNYVFIKEVIMLDIIIFIIFCEKQWDIFSKEQT
jgi:hypothetical protein